MRIERDWAEQVEQERYLLFRGVLEELALGGLPTEPPTVVDIPLGPITCRLDAL